MSGAFDQLSKDIAASGSKAGSPNLRTLREFLTTQAMVKTPGGDYVHWNFTGRECLSYIVDVFDLVIGSETGIPLPDATIDLCGGAQFGKTVLALNIGVYLTACRWYNWGYYLPDDDLVEGIVDSKLRPDVIEQIDWLGPLMSVGTFEDKRGKSVNRKGAARVSDGKHKAFMMIRGMGKIPTSFSMDAVFEDEKDDIPDKRSKFLTGRMTASDLRLKSSLGTQRVHGRGQQRQWADGSQGVFEFAVPGGKMINLEENWPAVCRMAVDGTPKATDPKLDNAAMFRDADGNAWDPDPAARYYLADPETGEPIDRTRPHERHLRPERIKQRKWSWRISQLGIAAVDLRQVVSRWESAVRDPESMVVFCCDVLALPRNTTQGISPEIIERARNVEAPFDLSLSMTNGRVFAGLDTGDRCWFMARDVQGPFRKRYKWAERIALGDVVRRTVQLCGILGPDFLVIDARPAADEARTICWIVNGLDGAAWPMVADPDSSVVTIGGVTWDGPAKTWRGIKAAVCEFTLKPGGGMRWKAGRHIEDGMVKLYPVLETSRYDSIDRVVKELLTPAENVIRSHEGRVVADPVMRMPRGGTGASPAVEEMARHFQVGSERDDQGDYVDKCENHFLLAATYSALAEQAGGNSNRKAATAVQMLPSMRPEFRRKGGMI